MRLRGDLAVVSGAASGIGLATCRLFVAEGARVVALDHDPSPEGDLRVSCDVADTPAVEEAAKAASALGPVTIVVHAAGIMDPAATLETTPESLAHVHDVNVGGALRLARAFAPGMLARGGGAFVFVSSINAARGTPGLAAYASSKAALEALMRTLALELAPGGVRANCVAPASIDTPMLRASFARADDPDLARRANIARHPLGRLGLAEDVANLILFLASSDSGWITGGVFPVDGGAGLTRA